VEPRLSYAALTDKDGDRVILDYSQQISAGLRVYIPDHRQLIPRTITMVNQLKVIGKRAELEVPCLIFELPGLSIVILIYASIACEFLLRSDAPSGIISYGFGRYPLRLGDISCPA